MVESFSPARTIEVLCRFCRKVVPATLDRGIAANGKTVGRESTFEYYCTKCQHSFCFTGTDLLAQPGEVGADGGSDELRDYNPKLHYLIGETIYHKKFHEKGSVVCKEVGTPARIVVNFEKSGIRKLIEGA